MLKVCWLVRATIYFNYAFLVLLAVCSDQDSRAEVLKCVNLGAAGATLFPIARLSSAKLLLAVLGTVLTGSSAPIYTWTRIFADYLVKPLRLNEIRNLWTRVPALVALFSEVRLHAAGNKVSSRISPDCIA